MYKEDRLDMLRKLSMFDKHDDSSIFNKYMSAYYAEIYSFYSLLKDMEIGYSELEFREPIKIDGRLSFAFDCNKGTSKQIKEFFDSYNSDILIIKYLRKHEFEVSMDTSDGVIMHFNTPIKEE